MTPTRPIPMLKDVVLVGGGHAHALVLKAWGMKPVPGARLTLINPAPTAPYTGMLPGYVAGHYKRDEVAIDLVRLARFAGARLILSRAEALEADQGRLHVAGRGVLEYDLLSLDIGVTADMPDIPGFARYGLPAKPMDVFAKGWDAALTRGAVRDIAVIGGGVAGVELALAAQHRVPGVRVRILERGRVLAPLPPASRAALLSVLKSRDIEILEDADVAEIRQSHLSLKDGSEIAADIVIGAAGARAQAWLGVSDLTTQAGYVSVRPSLQSLSHGNVYAAGDCADLSFAPRPKAGVFAVRAAPVLTANLRAALTGGPQHAFRPQRDYLKLVSLGRQEAIGERGGLRVQGAWVWRLKDRIDRAFMRKLTDLPSMPAPTVPKGAAKGVATALNAPPVCGGCGAKVGAGALAEALAAMPSTTRNDIVQGAGDDAAILSIAGQEQVITTDHLRGFALDPALVARIALHHAAGDVLAMGAAPQAALAQIILPPMAPRLQTRALIEVMAAAGGAAAELGLEIAGGHSTEGAELSIGFTVTGLLSAPAKTLGAAKAGDVLVLTRPIGSGVLLAGEMAMRAKGADIATLWATLCQPQAEIARALAQHAHAMTDVTGFGLAGHLGGI
ncbi:MAG: selenide, water dikinase SelD, partial [Pseudomonadota bacterium]